MTARQIEQNKQMARSLQHEATVSALQRPVVTSLLALTLLGIAASGAVAQSASIPTTPGFADLAFGGQAGGLAGISHGIVGFDLSSPGQALPANAPSKSFSEILRGNGTGIGYTLTHGGILPDTVSVHASGNHLRAGTDYWLDPTNGTITFAQSIHTFESVDVYYRYVEGQDAQRQSAGLPGLQFGLGSASRLGLFFGSAASNGSGFNSTLYGMALDSKSLLSGRGNYSGLMFFSNTAKSNNLVTLMPGSAGAGAAQSAPQAGVDNLILQSLALHSSGFGIHADYQDVGKNFAGFQALRMNNASDKAMLDQLTQLEKEKGLRRMGFGLDFGLNFGQGKTGSASHGGFSFSQENIADAHGSVQRDLWSLKSGTFDFLMFGRSVSPGFKRFDDLSDADKTNLALDLYQLYDPKAAVAQVTAGDRAQVAHETGLERSAMRADFGFGKAGGIAFSQLSIQDTTNLAGTAGATPTPPVGIMREDLALNLGSLQLDLLHRKTDAGFSRLGDLADVEKNNLALDIRRQFDPNVTPQQLAQKDRDQATREAGLTRTALRGHLLLGRNGKDGQLNFSQFAIADEPLITPGSATLPQIGTIQRMMLEYVSKPLHILMFDQTISNAFTQLSSLSDVEHAQFANEHGMRHSQISLDWQVNKTTHLGFSSVNVGSTPDAVAAAVAAASQAGQSTQAVAQAATNGFSRQSLQFDTQGLKLGFNATSTSAYFTRTGDLTLPAPDQQSILASRGFNSTDFLLHFDRMRGLTLDTDWYNAINSLDGLSHDIDKENFAYNPNKRFSLSFQHNADLATAFGGANGTDHSLLSLNQNFGKGMLLNLYHDDNATYSQGDLAQDATTDFVHFETDKTKPNTFLFEDKRVSYLDNRSQNSLALNSTYQDTLTMNLHMKPTSKLSVNYSLLDVDQGAEPSALNNSLDFAWQTSKKLAVVAGVTQTDTNNNQNAAGVTIGLQGEPARNVTLAAKFNEVHQDTIDSKDVADISISNSKPFCLGPLQNITLTARYAALNDMRKLQNETMTGHAAWTLWKNQFLLDYNGIANNTAISNVTRTYSFITDPNPQKRFHASFLYKDRTFIDGSQKLTRRFTADWKIAKATNFVYNYGTLPDDDKGNITPTTTADIELKHAIRPDLSASFYYRLNDNIATKIMTSGLGFSLTGQLDHRDKLELGYTSEANGFPDHITHGNHFHILFDHKISTDNYFTFSADYRTDTGPALFSWTPSGEIQGNLDYRLKF
jgi:hypothetical protein